MKRINLPIVYAIILAMIAWLAIRFFVGCADFSSRSHEDMKQQAETAIKEAGGVEVLEKEAKVILSDFRVESDWITTSNGGAKCPAITKLQSLLAPYEHGPWVVEPQKNLPSHIVIRFGSHRYYAYVWIFDSEHVPLGKIEGAEHLSGAVYLSEMNQ